jgi:flagellar M-ring protein FliF
LRALEGELARTIRSISRVQTARVHLVMPEKRLFERDREPPRASIVLKLRGELETGQVRAVRHLVASAVEGLKPERVSIVDERGRLLADGAQSDSALSGLGIEEKQAAMERRLRMQVEEIIAGIVGVGRARVQVSADLDQNRVESRSETYDPEGRVARSSSTNNESQITNNGEGAVSAGNELPGANQGQAGGGAKDSTNKTQEVTNYEISRTTRTEIIESGRLKRLSVAVLVDGIYTKAANGEATYQPRPPEELERIASLVRTAIGFDKNRGDQVEIVNLRFAETPMALDVKKEETLLSSLLSPTKDDILRLTELLVISLLTLLVLMMVVRPLVRRMLDGDAGGKKGKGGRGYNGTSTQQTFDLSAPPAIADGAAASKLLESAILNGQIPMQTVDKFGEIVRDNPQDAVAVMRSWINEKQ